MPNIEIIKPRKYITKPYTQEGMLKMLVLHVPNVQTCLKISV